MSPTPEGRYGRERKSIAGVLPDLVISPATLGACNPQNSLAVGDVYPEGALAKLVSDP